MRAYFGLARRTNLAVDFLIGEPKRALIIKYDLSNRHLGNSTQRQGISERANGALNLDNRKLPTSDGLTGKAANFRGAEERTPKGRRQPGIFPSRHTSFSIKQKFNSARPEYRGDDVWGRNGRPRPHLDPLSRRDS